MKETLCIVILNIFIISFNSVLSQSDGSKCGQIPQSFLTNFASGPKNNPEDNPSGYWPWMASIGNYSRDNKWQHYCGATLISDQHFLTAAHCVKVTWKIERLKIRIGDSNHVSNKDDANVEVLSIIDATVHPKFNGVSAYYDVAVLKTKKITFSRAKIPVCLPTSFDVKSFDVNKYEDKSVHLIGWGSSILNGNLNARIKRVDIKVFSQKKCNVTHMNRPLSLNHTIQTKLPELFPSHVLCAGDDFGKQGSCHGDSGGPLLFHNWETNSWIQFALVQGAVKDCGDIDYPGIYIRLEDPSIFSFIHSFLESPKMMTKVLVASGLPYVKSVEIINLDGNNQNKNCDDLPDLPLGMWGATGKLFKRKTPIICGGKDNSQYSAHCKCQAFQNGSWRFAPDLKECRSYSDSEILTNSDKKEVFLIVGGYDKNFNQLNTSATFDGSVWNNLYIENRPEPVNSHCIVKINSSTILSIGGYGKFKNDSLPSLLQSLIQGGAASKNTYFYNIRVNKWTPGPPLKERPQRLVCGILKWKNSKTNEVQNVIVAANPTDEKTTVELLYLNNYGKKKVEWVFGPELLESKQGSTMIEYNNSVILIGGGNGRTLFQLSSPNGPWIKMRQKLKYFRDDHVSFLVPDEIVNCHD